MSGEVNGNRAAIAVLCGDEAHYGSYDCFYDYPIAIFEGASIGDAIMQFADWKLDNATMNMDGAWRSSPQMRKFAREWYFPPVPEGFDFAAVEPQEKRGECFYDPVFDFSPRQSEKNRSKYYLWPYEKQFAHFIGVLKFYSRLAENNANVKGLRIEPPYPCCRCDKTWNPSHGFDPLFAYTPYFKDRAEIFADPYEIIDAAVGAEAVAKLKDRYSGIDCENIIDGLREAYAKGQFSVFHEFWEDEDLHGIRVEAKGMLFTRYLAGVDPGEEEYGWQMCLRLWPKNDRDCFWKVDFEGEAILDRMVIESRSADSQESFAKWWLKHRHRPEKPDESGEDCGIEALVKDLLSLPVLDPKSE